MIPHFRFNAPGWLSSITLTHTYSIIPHGNCIFYLRHKRGWGAIIICFTREWRSCEVGYNSASCKYTYPSMCLTLEVPVGTFSVFLMHIHVYDAEAALIFSLTNVTTLPLGSSSSAFFSTESKYGVPEVHFFTGTHWSFALINKWRKFMSRRILSWTNGGMKNKLFCDKFFQPRC